MRIVSWVSVLAIALLALSAPAAANEQAELDKVVRRLMPEVAKIRGLDWKRDVVAKMLSKKELRERLIEMTAEDYPAEEQARDNRIVHALGVLPEDQTIIDVVRKLMAEIVAGYYDPDAEQLFVIEGPVGAARIPTLVHELIHALDDQHYDLKALEKPDEDNADRQFAWRCLFEGCAVHGQHLHARLDPKAAAAEIQQSLDGEDEDAEEGRSALLTTPTWLIIDTLLHYRAGPYLVGQLAGSDYPGTMKRLYDDPPTTQEQFLHPHKWLDPTQRDLPRKVKWKGDWSRVGYGWKVVHDTPVGELNFALFLNHFLDDEDGLLTQSEAATSRLVTQESYDAASGWDAGQSVILERPDERLVIVHALAFDSNTDATEAHDALRAALKARNTETWKTPDAWRVEDGSTSDTSNQFQTYHDGRGMGVLVRRKNELLWIDGFKRQDTWGKNEGPHGWTPLIEHLLATTFVQDPNDRGDEPAPNPFAGCELTMTRRGLGINLPTADWTATENKDAKTPSDPVATIALRKGASIRLLAMEQGIPREAIPVVLQLFVPDLDKTKLREVKVAGRTGYHYPVGRNAGQQMDLYASSDGVRLIVALVVGQPQIVRLYDDEIEKIIANIISVPGY